MIHEQAERLETSLGKRAHAADISMEHPPRTASRDDAHPGDRVEFDDGAGIAPSKVKPEAHLIGLVIEFALNWSVRRTQVKSVRRIQ